MELRHLRYFVAIVDRDGYRKASQHLHVAQPALTQTIKDLEEELGAKLLLRSQRGVTLTPSGKEFYAGAKKTLEAADQTIVSAKHAATGTIGSLSLGFIPGAVQHFLPKLIKRFKEQNPRVELHLHELPPASQQKALTGGELDLAFTREPIAEERRQLSTQWLFDVPLIVVLPTSFPFHGGAVPIGSLRNTPLNLIGRDQSPVLFDSIIGLCQSVGFTPRVTSYPDLAESMYTLVEAGEGVSIAPMWTRVFLPESLPSHRIDPDTVRVELVAAWRTNSNSVTLQSFLRLLEADADEIKACSRSEFEPPDHSIVSL